MELFDCALIGVCVVIRLKRVTITIITFTFTTHFSLSPAVVKMDTLIYCSLKTPKREIGSADPDQILQNAASEQEHLNRVSTVCKLFNHFSVGLSKSHICSLTYLKLKLESSNI